MPTTHTVEPASSPLVLSDRPAWRLVLALCWPMLLQQLLVFAVMLYDALLAGRFQPKGGHHIAAQAAQTTATYLAWFSSSYTVLVTVGSTALVARFTGAGDRSLALRATNQSIVLAVVLGLLGTAAGLVLGPWAGALAWPASGAAGLAGDF